MPTKRGWALLVDQLLGFPLADHDDEPDANGMYATAMRGSTRFR